MFDSRQVDGALHCGERIEKAAIVIARFILAAAQSAVNEIGCFENCESAIPVMLRRSARRTVLFQRSDTPCHLSAPNRRVTLPVAGDQND